MWQIRWLLETLEIQSAFHNLKDYMTSHPILYCLTLTASVSSLPKVQDHSELLSFTDCESSLKDVGIDTISVLTQDEMQFWC